MSGRSRTRSGGNVAGLMNVCTSKRPCRPETTVWRHKCRLSSRSLYEYCQGRYSLLFSTTRAGQASAPLPRHRHNCRSTKDMNADLPLSYVGDLLGGPHNILSYGDTSITPGTLLRAEEFTVRAPSPIESRFALASDVHDSHAYPPCCREGVPCPRALVRPRRAHVALRSTLGMNALP